MKPLAQGSFIRRCTVDAKGAHKMSQDYRAGRAWIVTAMLTLLMLINFLDKVVVGLTAVPIMRELGLTPREFGWIAGSFFSLFSVSAAAVGFVANRVATRWLLFTLAAIWSVIQVPFLFTSSVVIVIVCRVILGAAEGPGTPVATHALYKWFPDRKRNLPILVMNQGAVAGLLLAGIGIPWISNHWGWRMNFGILGVAGLVWCAIWLVLGREGSVARPSTVPGASADMRVPYRVLLGDATILCTYLTGFVTYAGLALMLTWMPVYLQLGLGYDPIHAGRIFAVIVAVSAPVSLMFGSWSQRLLKRGTSSRAARAIFSSVCVIGAGALLAGLLIPGLAPVQKVLLLAIAGAMPPVIYSLHAAILAEVAPDAQRGGIIGLGTAVSSLAGLIAPVICGQLVQAYSHPVSRGYEIGFAVAGLAMMAGGIAGLIWMKPEDSTRRVRMSAAFGRRVGNRQSDLPATEQLIHKQ
ncbi:sugar phosphate permease [Paraburkholderia sp. BL23I1N1]|nr:sugar phosphate permease [Paraburkholderia sp. BL23I1N1]